MATQVSYVPLEANNLSSLGVAAPTFTPGDTTPFFATSSFLYSLCFTAIVIAAFYRYTVAGILRMQASEAAIRKSNEIIRDVTLGLLGVFSLFLILFTVNKDLVRGDIDLRAVLAGGSDARGSAPLSTSVSPVGDGAIASRIYAAALVAKTTLSSANAPGTNNGRLACAWAVNEVLKSAGLAPIGNSSVVTMETALRGGRGAQVQQQASIAGDIVVEAGAGHVGICMNKGCSSVVSNSSSHAFFNWMSGPDFSPSYKNGVGRFYRVNK